MFIVRFKRLCYNRTMIKSQRGFTMTEVLIFLAISGAMFTMAFVGTRSQQDSVAFRQAVNDIELKLREVFNNVDNGYFGNQGQYQCGLGTTDADDWISASVTDSGGSNSNCVFMGKVLRFDSGQMYINTLIGSRSTIAISYNHTLLRETYGYPYNLKFDQIKVSGSQLTGPIIAAYRDKNESGNSDLRARRYYKGGVAANTWPTSLNPISDSAQPKICLSLSSDKKASITITQKDLIIDYNGVGC